MTILKHLYYPVLGLEACPLRWRVVVHSSDVLAWPGLLAVQVEPIAVSAPLDHAQTRPQLASTHLLNEDRAEDMMLICCT